MIAKIYHSEGRIKNLSGDKVLTRKHLHSREPGSNFTSDNLHKHSFCLGIRDLNLLIHNFNQSKNNENSTFSEVDKTAWSLDPRSCRIGKKLFLVSNFSK